MHDVDNLAFQALLDVLVLVAVSAPIWTAMLWGRERRGWFLGLVLLVQAPAAVIVFVPVADPALHVVTVVTALALTATALRYVRRTALPPLIAAPRHVRR